MRKIIVVIILVCAATSLYAQQNNAVVKQPSSNLIIEQHIEKLNARIDSITIAHNQAIEMVKEEQKVQYSNYYTQLDSDLDRFLVYMSIFWGILGVILGIIMPSYLNYRSEEKVKVSLDNLAKQVYNSLQNNARGQNMRNNLFERHFSLQMQKQIENINKKIESQNKYVDDIKNEIESYEKQSKINSLLSEASNILEDNPDESIQRYTQVLMLDSNNDVALL